MGKPGGALARPGGGWIHQARSTDPKRNTIQARHGPEDVEATDPLPDTDYIWLAVRENDSRGQLAICSQRAG